MRDWPPITSRNAQRLALDDMQFKSVARDFWNSAGPREFGPLDSSGLLATPGSPGWFLHPARRERRVAGRDRSGEAGVDRRGLHEGAPPALSFGGNGAPNWLTEKFAHFPDEEIGPCWCLPATSMSSTWGPPPPWPRSAACPPPCSPAQGLWCERRSSGQLSRQVAQLTWSEIPYLLWAP